MWAASLEPLPGALEAYGLDGPDLATFLATLPLDNLEAARVRTNATVWLPVCDGMVIGQFAAGNPPAADARRISLVPRTIAIAPLTSAQAVGLFGEVLGRTVLAAHRDTG